MDLGSETGRQIAALDLQPDKPLLVFDADEVLLHFALPFSQWLNQRDWHLHLHHYSLLHAIKSADGAVADASQTRALIEGFINMQTRHQPATAGAAACLAHFALQAQILVLTNVPQHRRLERVQNLVGHAMPYRVIANQGAKGPALAELSRRVAARIGFVDDNPDQITSALDHAPHVHRIHFSGCDLVRAVLPQAKSANSRPQSWAELQNDLTNFLG